MSRFPNAWGLRFVTAAHYFADCSMGNFWSTFSAKSVEVDLESILNDGFNTVMILVPWAQFQPRMRPLEFDQQMLDRLELLVAAARRVGLKIVLRIGYLWDNSPARVSTVERYRLIVSDLNVREAWVAYLQKIAAVVDSQRGDVAFFFSWEDVYWAVLRVPSQMPMSRRVELASQLGFHSYLTRRYDAALLGSIHGVTVGAIEEVPVPIAGEPLFDEYVLFFDREVIERLIIWTSQALNGNIWYEHRIDPDVTMSSQGAVAVEHSTYKVGVAADAVYYHPKIGSTSSSSLNSDEALQHLKRFVSGFRQNSIHKRPLFLDQFNFKVDNPKHPDFKRIPDDVAEDFVRRCAGFFLKALFGYGVWGYRDWRDDKVFNGRFELGLKGWREGGAVDLLTDTSGIVLGEGGWVEQVIRQPLANAKVIVEVASESLGATVVVRSGDVERRLEVSQSRVAREVSFEVPAADLSISCASGVIRIFRVIYFSHVFTNGLRSIDGGDTPTHRAVVDLNRKLTKLQNRVQ